MPATFSQPRRYMAGLHGSEQFNAQDSPPFIMAVPTFHQGYIRGQPSGNLPVTSTSAPGYDPRGRDINEFMYQVGFLQGRYSDVNLHVPTLQNTFPLHALFLARSPVLNELLKKAETAVPRMITLNVNDKISSSAFQTVLSHLYHPLSNHSVRRTFYESPALVMEYLNVSVALGLEDVQCMVLDVITNDTNPDHILTWVQSLPDYSECPNRLLSHLVQNLARKWEVFRSNSPDGSLALARVYAHLPLDYLRVCIENEDLPVLDAMQRFNFAKQVIRLRPNQSMSVALSFDEGDVSVKVVKNSRRRKSGGWDPSAYYH